MWKIYKEGQGSWARGVLVALVGIGGVFAVTSLHNALEPPRQPWMVGSWPIDYRWLFDAPLLIGVLVFGVWLFNHPPMVDFLIDTESELKNKVTWPSKEEEVNASVVVVVTVVCLMAFILAVDFVFSFVRDFVYPPGVG